MKRTVNRTVLELAVGDITGFAADAIVNAANEQLAHGGGVAGAIAARGGPVIQEESDLWVAVRGPVPVGTCAITGAGKLPARYVIHAVGPRQGAGDEGAKLRLVTRAALETAEKHNLASIAFPAISAGLFGVPVDVCAEAMVSEAVAYSRTETKLSRISFVLSDAAILGMFKERLAACLAGP